MKASITHQIINFLPKTVRGCLIGMVSLASYADEQSSTTWNCGTSGSWSTSSCWNNGVPTSTSSVVFNNYPAAYAEVTITVDTAATASTLTFNEGGYVNNSYVNISGTNSLTVYSINVNTGTESTYLSFELSDTASISTAYSNAYSFSLSNTSKGSFGAGGGSTFTSDVTLADSSSATFYGITGSINSLSGSSSTSMTFQGANIVGILSGSSAITINGDSSLQVQSSSSQTQSGNIQTDGFEGTGSLIMNGSGGTFNMTGPSNELYDITVQQGTLSIGTSSVTNVNLGINSGGAIAVSGASTVLDVFGTIIEVGVPEFGYPTLTVSCSTCALNVGTASAQNGDIDASVPVTNTGGTISVYGTIGNLTNTSGTTTVGDSTHTAGTITTGSNAGTLSVYGTLTSLTNTGGTTTFYNFATTPSSVAINGGTVSFASLTSTTPSITNLSGTGGTLNIGSGKTMTLGNTSAATYSGVIANGSGTAALTYNGSSTLTLDGINTYTGATIVSGGTLQIGDSSTTTASIGDSSAVTIDSGGTLSVYSNSVPTSITINSGGTLKYNGSTSISGITISNSGTFDISGWSGTGNFSFTPTSFSGNGGIKLGANTLGVSSTASFGGVISGTGVAATGGGLAISSGTTTMSAANTYAGYTTLTGAANLTLTGSGAITSSDLALNGTGIFSISGVSGSGATIQTLSGSGTSSSVALGGKTLTINGNLGSAVTYAGNIGGTGGALVYGTGASATDQLTLSGTNTYTGGTTVSGGTLAFSTNSSFNGGNVAINAANNTSSTMDLSALTGTVNINQLSGTVGATASSSTLKLGTNTLNINGSPASTLTFAGAITGTSSSSLTYAAIGSYNTLTLSGANTYQGTTTVTSGTLAISGSLSAGKALAVASTATFDIHSSSSNFSFAQLSGAGTVSLGSNTLTIGCGASTTCTPTFSGAIQQASSTSGGSLTYNDIGTAGNSLTLSGANTYTGTTTVTAGSLILGSTGSLATTSSLVNNATFDMHGISSSGVTLAGLAGTTNAATITMGTKNLTINGTGGSYYGNFTGSGNFSYGGSGTQTLYNSLALGYTGTTTVSSGTLQIGSSIASRGGGTGAGAITVNNGATLTLYGALNAATTNNGTVNYYSNASSSQAIANGTSTSSGTLTFGSGSSANYTGTITNGYSSTYTGALKVTGTGTLAGATVTNSYGYVDISGASSNVTIGTLSGAGTVYLGAKQLTLSNASTISGNINDGSNTTPGGGTLGSLKYSGSGTLILNYDGNLGYTGATTVSSGTLQIGDASNNTGSGTGAITVASGANLTLYGTLKTTTASNSGKLTVNSGASLGSATITNGGTMLFTGASPTESSATINNTGGIIDISGSTGIVTIGNVYDTAAGGSIYLGNATHTNTLEIETSGGGQTLYSILQDGSSSGSGGGSGGSLYFNGTSTLILDAANTFTGLTTVANSTLQIGDSTHTGANASLTGNIQVNQGKQLNVYGQTFTGTTTNSATVDGTVKFLGGASSGAYTSFTLVPSASAVLDISQNLNSLNQPVGVSVYSLATSGAASSTASVTLGANTLTIAGGAGNNFSGIISGTGGVTLDATLDSSNSTFELSGANTYTGSTTVTAGTLNIGDSTTPVSTTTGAISVAQGATLSLYGALKASGTTNNGTINYNGNATGSSQSISNGVTSSGTLNFTTGSANYTGTITNGTSSTIKGMIKFAGTGTAAGATINNQYGYVDISGATSGVGIGTLYGAGNVYLGGNTLTLANSSSQTISGVLANGNASGGGSTGGSLTYAPTSATTLTLTAANTYTGTTTVSAGTLAIGNDSTYLTAAIAGNATVNNGATLLVNGKVSGTIEAKNGGVVTLGDTVHNAGTVTGTVTVDSGGKLNVNSANGSTLAIQNSGTTYFLNNATAANTSITLNSGSITDISGITSSSLSLFSLTDNGGGTIYLGSKQLALSANTTITSVIADSSSSSTLGGSLSLSNATYTLDGANTYDGLTTVSAATLNIGNTTGTYLNAAVLGGITATNNSTVNVYGTLAGTQTIGAGSTLQIGDPAAGKGALGTLNGPVNNSGAVVFYNNTGSGSVALNNETLGSSIEFGALSTSGSSLITNSGTVAYIGNNSANLTSIINGSNATIDISGLQIPSITLGSLNGSGTVILGANELEEGSLNQNDTFSGQIVNSALLNGFNSNTAGSFTKVGTGTLLLNGVNTYTGLTTVEDGTLQIGDNLHPNASVTGPVNIDANGILAGYGQVGSPGTTVTNDGIISPGGSGPAGILTIRGNFSQTANGDYLVNFNNDGTFSSLVVDGVAYLGGTVTIVANAGFTVNTSYLVLLAGDIVGTFETAVVPKFFNLVTLYTQTMFELAIFHNPYEMLNAAKTPNQFSVVHNIIDTGATAPINAAIAVTTDDEQFDYLIDQLSGATYANQQMALAQAGQPFENELAYRLDRNVLCNVSSNQPSCDDQKYWVKLYDSKNEFLNTFNVSGLQTDQYGVQMGAEAVFNDTATLGAAFGYSYLTHAANGNEIAHTSGSLYQGAVYGRYDVNNWRVGVEVDYGITGNMNADRAIQNPLPGVESVMTHGNYRSTLFGAQIRTSYDLVDFYQIGLRPTAALLLEQVRGLHFTENSHTGFELSIDSNGYQSHRSQLGLALETGVFHNINPVLFVAWEHEFDDVSAEFDAIFTGLTQEFYIKGTELGYNTLYINAGLELLNYQGFDIGINYQGRFAKEWNQNMLGIEVGVF